MELFTLILHNFFSFIVIISVIVFIHEFGHYWVARRCGVRVDAFSIGFGPEVWGWDTKSGTRWKICAIPMGGYVKMFGDEGAASTPDNKKLKKLTKAEEKVAFHTQPLFSKTLIVLAGPVANFLLAIIILSCFFATYGRPEATSEIGEVKEKSAAASIGLVAGDVIIELDGTKISRFEDIRNIATLNPNLELSITYDRAGKIIHDKITPVLSETTDIFGNKVKIGILGVLPGAVTHKEMSPGEAVAAGVTETYDISVRTLKAIGQIIVGTRSRDELSGILRIGDYSGKAVDRGFETVLWFMAVLSINLGLINLFPVPMLDGGHILFYAIEAARGRPLAEKVQEYAFRIGFTLLIMLMIFATFNDLKHFGIF